MARQPHVRYIGYYTDGSAAKKVAPAFPAKKVEKPKVRRRKRKVVYVDPVATVGILVAFSMLMFMLAGLNRLHTAQRETAQMEQYVEYLDDKNADLATRYENGYDISDIEKKALAMGMVPKDAVRQVPIAASIPQAQEEAGMWQRITTFLTGLFA